MATSRKSDLKLLPEPQPKLSTDELLREHGYRIHSRPKTGEPTWLNRQNLPTKQSVAVRVVATESPPAAGA